ncbi:TIGR02594 family protein [Vogesella facilis]|uniref:TIGR02594 family protein n=1 Tax=Vogesella facilis TaxID=1655232 RepID=A0ABV7RCD3_9NEIS
MPKWLKAKYDTENKIASYTDQQGNFLIRSGGSLPWRINNPGNLRPAISPQGLPAPKKVKTHIGFAQAKNKDGALSYFLIFSDYETGVNELRNNLHRLHSNKRISEAIEAYAPRKENNTNRYIEQVELFSGLSRNQVINTLQASEFERLVQAIIRIEGYNDQSKGPRQEKLVAASNVIFSDGSRPIANQPAIIQQGGQQKETKTSTSGRLPPIVHKPEAGPIDILVRNTKGTLEKVLSIDPTAKAKHYLAVLEQWVTHSSSASHLPNNSSRKTSRPNTQYVVQPGDTLSKIAKIFKSNVTTIQKANDIKNPNHIYPGLRLEIPAVNISHTEAPQTSSPAPVRQPPKPRNSASKRGDVKPARSKDGLGSPIALLPSDNRRAPWMEVAMHEALRWHGQHESIIDKSMNYHKEIGQGWLKTIEGDKFAWCASFVNYCLKTSGYPISSPNPMRANSFISDNINFIKIEKPIFGCIATNGKHATFFYGESSNGKFIGLGGNQGQTIKFSSYKNFDFFIPSTYKPKYDNEKKEKTQIYRIADLNKSIGIMEKSKNPQTESTR